MKKIISRLLLVVALVLTIGFVSTVKSEAVVYSDSPVELRGVWVATVSNIDIAKQSNTSAQGIQTYKDRLTAILNKMENYGMNAMFFQVRPSNDAFYNSAYNPWSEYFVGQGINPGWDMLSWLADECHKRGIQLHAWLNPYRVTGSNVYDFKRDTLEEINAVKKNLRASIRNSGQKVNNPILIENDEEFLEEIVAGAEDKLVLNPARQVTIDHITNTINELITNYELDGIHFDDYFYPSGGIEQGVEQKDYAAYTQNGGTLDIKNWRRDNVNRMVKAVSDLVADFNETHDRYVAFGISPAAVWAPSTERCSDSRGQEGGMDVACGSYSSYNDLYADTRKWVSEEWIDYILPQDYFPMGGNYEQIVSWWASEVAKTNGVKLYVGTGLYRFSSGSGVWTDPEEINNQFDYVLSKPAIRRNVSGYVMFSYRNLSSSQATPKAAATKLQVRWKTGALLPTYKTSTKQVDFSNGGLDLKYFRLNTDSGVKYSVQFKQLPNANGYVIYAVNKGTTPDFTSSETILSKVYNQSTITGRINYTTTQTAVNNRDFYIRVFDLNNNVVKTEKLDFNNCEDNPGPQVTITTNVNKCDVGDPIMLNIKAVSVFELPLTVTLFVSHDNEEYGRESYELTLDENYEAHYEYGTFRDEVISFKVEATDRDKTASDVTPSIKVGNGTQTDVNPPSGDGGGEKQKSSCPFGAFMLLPLMAAGMLLAIRKREH